ncbi:tetratricopeptide repeat protein [Streptomyces kanamyceticus]|uniref:ATP-binding protein n=1 Tax=Streptomyces kanamyceticus TaxID=1967 RepID=A0A5J6GI25_STRKN|nr:tetratricopeptide repeat protein [Streptomyces kanamyceticus]QEU93711.1 ATP-binding protein [Streptomyces kanamyceticus]
MAQADAAEPSMQELIRRRGRAGFIGRRGELAAFRENFDVPPADLRHRFLFHVHGNAGVGKTSLVHEMEQLARERGALTAYVDESVGSVPEAMAAISAEFARQGRRLKELDQILTTHRERRHEAESAPAGPPAGAQGAEPAPSGGSMTVARASLVGLGLVPGVGAFAGAVDPAQLAQGADRLRASLSARFRNQEDVQLVLSPERVLTPVLLRELAQAAKAVPWVVLLFDTYERTSLFLDGWLHEVMTTERHGALPAKVVVVTAGQQPFDTTRWGGYADYVTDVPLGPFTEEESRGLLAGKGVVAEPVIEEVLRLSGGLPVLVSTLAENRPTEPDDVGDPSVTAVERFLKWEQDPVRRASALACALPRRLDADVVGAAVAGVCQEAEVPGVFAWLRSLPFVSDRGDRLQYHDVVRAPMLRLQRHRSPRGWAELHGLLARTFGQWRSGAAAGREDKELWMDEAWRELRIAESYHLLCGSPRTALPAVLGDFVEACDVGRGVAQRWARLLVDAGEDAEAEAVGAWGRDLLAALGQGAGPAALQLLLDRAGLDTAVQAVARQVRARDLRESGLHAEALAEYDRAFALDPELERTHYGRGVTYWYMDDEAASLASLDRAVELSPDLARTYSMRGEVYRNSGRLEEALRDLDRAVELDATDEEALASRGCLHHTQGRHDAALADLDRAIALAPDYVWALVRRGMTRVDLDQYDRALVDLNRAVELAPSLGWVVCDRGNALRTADRDEEALADYDKAIELGADNWTAYAGRGVSRGNLGRREEAIADLDRALELAPDYAWARAHRAKVLQEMGEYEKALADADRAKELSPDTDWILYYRATALYFLDRYEEARADLDRAIELDPEYHAALCRRSLLLRQLDLYHEAFADLDRVIGLEPRSGWALRLRAGLASATGRTERALADLAAYAECGAEPDWARRARADVHLWLGRPDLALDDLRPDAEAGGADGAEELAKTYLRRGEWARARAAAERLGEQDAETTAIMVAIVVTCAEGAAAAAPLWRGVERLAAETGTDSVWLDFLYAVIAVGRGDWAALDARLAGVLGPGLAALEWDDLAEMAGFLADLLKAPGMDRARLGPRLARVAAARDAFGARYAEGAVAAPGAPGSPDV